MDSNERQQSIAVAAYFRAEKQGLSRIRKAADKPLSARRFPLPPGVGLGGEAGVSRTMVRAGRTASACMPMRALQGRESSVTHFTESSISGNSELDDWLEAEREYDGLLTPFPDAMPNEGPPEADHESSGDSDEPVVPPSS